MLKNVKNSRWYRAYGGSFITVWNISNAAISLLGRLEIRDVNGDRVRNIQTGPSEDRIDNITGCYISISQHIDAFSIFILFLNSQPPKVLTCTDNAYHNALEWLLNQFMLVVIHFLKRRSQTRQKKVRRTLTYIFGQEHSHFHCPS